MQTAEVLKLAAKDHRHKAWEKSNSKSDDLEEKDQDDQHDGNSRWQNLEMLYIYIHTYIHICMCIYITNRYIYIHMYVCNVM